jgi:hypothetical protein
MRSADRRLADTAMRGESQAKSMFFSICQHCQFFVRKISDFDHVVSVCVSDVGAQKTPNYATPE